MSDSLHKPGLYRWKRQTDPKVYSRSQKVTTNNDIQDWIKKVEEASNHAAEAVFGGKHKRSTTLRNQLKDEDETHTEAQALLSQWVNDKIRLDNDMDEFDDEPWNKRSSEVKKEWDHLVDNTNEEYGMNYYRKQYKDEEDPYAFLADMDEGTAVDRVMDQMLKKKVVSDRVVNDLGFDDGSKYKDPRVKMELRHKQVKEKREKHEVELRRRRQEQQIKKEAHHRAKQMIIKEEQDKLSKQKKEDMLIKKEMAKIRKQMQDERKNMEELRRREEKKQEELMTYATQVVDLEEEDRMKVLMEHERRAEEKQRILLERLNEMKKRQAANDLRTLQRHFSAWYNLVLEKRLQMGKARAMADWRLLFRAWNAWRSFIRTKKVDIETKQHEVDIVQTQSLLNRKRQLAESHCRQTLLKKYFDAWQMWVTQEVERKEMERAQNTTKTKMAALLEAAATGKLWTGNETDRTDTTTGTSRTQSARSSRKPVTPSKSDIDSFFEQPSRRPQSSKSESSLSESPNQNRGNRVPTQPWQVTKKHVYLTNQEIANMGDSEDHVEQTNIKVRKRFGTQPWMNTKYITNNFENRHQAQQKILQEQQKQLKEQQRIIEELKYGQNQNKLQEQLEKQQAILEHLAKNITPRTIETDGDDKKSNVSSVAKQHSSASTKLRSPATNSPKDINSENKNQNNNVTAKKINSVKKENKVNNVAMETARSMSTAVTARTDSSNKSNTRYVQLMKNMDERAAERAKLKAERDEKRRKEEEEKLKQLEEVEELRRQELEAEKRAKAEAYREKKKLEKQKEMEKQQREEKLRQQNALADDHYQRSIMKYRGLLPFKRLADMAKKNEFTAISHHKMLIKRHVFKAWYEYVKYIQQQKEKLADNMYKYLIVKRSFRNWRNFKHHTIILEGRARRYYERNLKIKIFCAWSDWACQEVLDSINKDQKAQEFYIWKLKKTSFDAIKNFPEEEKRQKERDKRRAEMRQKVAEMLPDFSLSSLTTSNELT